jgi:hypothetical protein
LYNQEGSSNVLALGSRSLDVSVLSHQEEKKYSQVIVLDGDLDECGQTVGEGDLA